MASAATATRLRRWLEARGGRLERFAYPRPEAGGEVEAWRLVPAVARLRVVVAHGAGNDALFPQAALFRALCEAAAEVFAFDLDGHGAHSTTTLSVDGLRAALSAAVAEAGRRGPTLPLHLVGHSLGGALVLDALAAGLEATSAVIISAPLALSLGLGIAVRELASFLSPATLRQRRHYGLGGMIPAAGPFRRGVYPIRGATRPDAPFAYADAVAALLHTLDLPARAAQILTPALLVYGTADRLAPVAAGRLLGARIPSGTLIEVPGGTHWSTGISADAIGSVVRWIAAIGREP
jgi:alpha-beta hydrolase superfamily lysophospholipase